MTIVILCSPVRLPLPSPLPPPSFFPPPSPHPLPTLLYRFDSCYDETISQADLYRNEIKDLVLCPLRGQNASCFAYGPTGAGKHERLWESAMNIERDRERRKGGKRCGYDA